MRRHRHAHLTKQTSTANESEIYSPIRFWDMHLLMWSDSGYPASRRRSRMGLSFDTGWLGWLGFGACERICVPVKFHVRPSSRRNTSDRISLTYERVVGPYSNILTSSPISPKSRIQHTPRVSTSDVHAKVSTRIVLRKDKLPEPGHFFSKVVSVRFDSWSCQSQSLARHPRCPLRWNSR